MSVYAIVETGSKQYRVEPQNILEVEKISVGPDQKEVSLDHVLLLCDGDRLHIGTPTVRGAKVLCDYLGDIRSKKVISFKFRKRKASRRKHGHRQDISRLRVREIKF